MNLIRRSIHHFSISKFNLAKDYYKVLGIKTSSDQKQIKKAFRDLAKKYHPDSSTGNQEKFKQVNEAYQVLSESDVKKEYDQARSYGQAHSTNQSYNNKPNAGYNNYGNGQYYYNQTFHQDYQNPSQSSQYRGYSKPDGWQNQKYRQDVMNQIFKEYQKQRSQYGSFESMYQNHHQNIRQYTDELKRRQQTIRKAYEAEEMRKERQWKEYQQKQIRDFEQKIVDKVSGLKQGFVKNVHGFIKAGDFIKDTLKNVASSIGKSVSKDDKNKKK